jgi:hypothetical protein
MVNGSGKTMAQIYEMQDIVVTPWGQTTAAPVAVFMAIHIPL